MLNLFNQKNIISSSNYQDFTEGLPFVVAAAVALLVVPGDSRQELTESDEQKSVQTYHETTQTNNGTYYAYEKLSK